jgi:hypothetical protein
MRKRTDKRLELSFPIKKKMLEEDMHGAVIISFIVHIS